MENEEKLIAKIKYDNIEYLVYQDDIYWDDEFLCFPLIKGGELRFKNAYPTKLSYNLDSVLTEDVTLVGNNKVWGKD